MKDFVTGKEIDIQALLRMVKYAEEAEQFLMRDWLNSCGTAGCLCGTFVMREKPNLADSYIAMREESARIAVQVTESTYESDFLFLDHCEHVDYDGAAPALMLTKEQAISRLRKYIYYKCRKAELLGNEKGTKREWLESRERYRRLEGDLGICRAASLAGTGV